MNVGTSGHRHNKHEGQMMIARIHDVRSVVQQLDVAKITDSVKAFLEYVRRGRGRRGEKRRGEGMEGEGEGVMEECGSWPYMP